MTPTDLYKDIERFTAALTSAGRTQDADAISAAVRGGSTSTEILWSVRYRVLRLLALTDGLPVSIVASGRSLVAAIDEVAG